MRGRAARPAPGDPRRPRHHPARRLGHLRRPRRGAVNDWIRRSVDARIADGVADFDAVLRVSETDSRIRTPYLAYGDEHGMHPNSDGYEAMAVAVPLAALDEDEAPFEVTCS